jgi:hypothetical protein
MVAFGQFGLKELQLFKKESSLASIQPAKPDSELNQSRPSQVMSAKAEPVQNEILLQGPKKFTDAINAFLKPFGLNPYADKFRWALTNGKMTVFGDDLFKDTGYQLVELDHLNDNIRNNFGVLSIPNPINRGQTHYVLWRPPIQINNFYYYYQGVEINYLQSLLAKANFYHDKLDYIVGPRLMQAVVEFQKQNDLPVTGFPDPKTLFLLAHYQKEG